MKPEEMAVLAANQAFYQAFTHSDVDAMDAAWSKEAPVACVHPGWAPLIGRERVMQVWRGILENGSTNISFDHATAHVVGDTAYVLCREVVGGAPLAATNFFVLEHGQWKLVHHQATPVAPQHRQEPAPKTGTLN